MNYLNKYLLIFLFLISPYKSVAVETNKKNPDPTINLSSSPSVDESQGPTLSQFFLSAYKKPAIDIWWYSSPLLIGLVAFREDTVNHNQKEIAKNNSLRNNSRYGDYLGQLYINVAYAGSFALAGRYIDTTYYSNAKSMFWASATSGLTAQALKYIVRERRPSPDPDHPEINGRDRKSFPSGHTTSAFTFASVVQQYHGWAWGAPAYAMASFVGWSRMNDNKHYLHDVVFGAVLGATYGVGVSHLYKGSAKKTKPDQSLLLVPQDGGAEIVYSFLF